MNNRTALVLLGLVAFVYSQTLVVSSTAFFSNVVCQDTTKTNPCTGFACGGDGQSTCASYGSAYGDASLPPFQSRWGTPAGGGTKSGLGYSPITNVSTQIDSDFYVGTLTHFNFPINSGTAASSVRLNLIVSFKTPGGADVGTQTFAFTLSIDETPNSTPCVYTSTTPCADKISYPIGGFDRNSSFTYNDVQYTLQLKGFKESTSSLSSPIVDFISNENGSRLGYLFARITAACPSTCLGGGSVIITSDSKCVCNCTSATPCPSPQTFGPDCSCNCPSSVCKNGTVVKSPTGCSCDCSSVPCGAPKQQAADCSCSCPANICNGYPISNPNTCACSCPSATDLGCGANFVVTPNCQCSCPITDASCGANKIENPNPNICGCICDSTTCPTNFQKDPVSCGCVCSLSCPNGQVLPNCTCGNCVGNFQLNTTTGQCNGCSLSAANCTGGFSFDASACRCVCNQLDCNLYNNSVVVDSTKDCECRPCVAGECICGNGKVEVGEDCDLGPGNVTDPCCVNCKYTTDSCTDANLCNSNGLCDGAGKCSGRYKCPPNTVCTSYTCDPNIGDCVAVVQPNGTSCYQFTGQPIDLCARSCQSGECVDYTADNGLLPDCSDTNLVDCVVPRCDSTTGKCVFDVLPDGTSCFDGLSCTVDDICLSGNCTGLPRDCTKEPLKVNLTICNRVYCEEGGLYYSCNVVPDRVGLPCDDGNACTLYDVCGSDGECVSSRKTVRCPRASACQSFTCDKLTGDCVPTLFGNETVCNDYDNCTANDRCDNGTCVGYPNEKTALLKECGYVPPKPPTDAGNNTLIVLAAVLGAALVAGIAAAAIIVKKIQKSRLLDPETWNPDAFSSVGANPFYQASQKMVDSPLYEGN